MIHLKRSLFTLAIALSGVALAETPATTASVAAASEGKAIGIIDVRPSWTTKSGSFATENVVELGYQFSPTRTLSYLQDFYSNLYNPSETVSGADAKLGDGFIRTRLSKLLENKDLGLSLSYQNRVYLPTSVASGTAGMITKIRNYITLQQKVSDSVTVSLSELPIFHVYNRAGVGTKANSVFENRVYLITDIALTETLSLSLPLMFHQTRMARYDGAANSDSWSYFLWTYPELTYAVTPNTSLGLAFYSDNLAAADLSGVDISKGLENGVVQVVFGASL